MAGPPDALPGRLRCPTSTAPTTRSSASRRPRAGRPTPSTVSSRCSARCSASTLPTYLAVAWDGPQRTAAPRGVRRVQGQPPGDGGRPEPPAPRDPRGPGGLPDPDPRAARLRGRRRHRHARQEGRIPGLRRRHRHGRQGHAAAGLGHAGPRLPHGPRDVPGRRGRARVLRRSARPGRRRAGAHGRQRRQHPRRAPRRARSRPRSGSPSTGA